MGFMDLKGKKIHISLNQLKQLEFSLECGADKINYRDSPAAQPGVNCRKYVYIIHHFHLKCSVVPLTWYAFLVYRQGFSLKQITVI